MSLTTGNAERHAREDWLVYQLGKCETILAKLWNKNELSKEEMEQFDTEQSNREYLLDELDELAIYSGSGDLLDEDYADYFRDDLDVEKIAIRGIG